MYVERYLRARRNRAQPERHLVRPNVRREMVRRRVTRISGHTRVKKTERLQLRTSYHAPYIWYRLTDPL